MTHRLRLLWFALALAPSWPRAVDSTAAQARFRLTLKASVADFGAVGDGISDDTVAWRSAVAAAPPGGTLEVAGRLRVTSGATMSAPGVRVSGSPGAAILTNGSSGLVVTGSRAEISGLRFDSVARGASVDLGLVVQDADDVHVTHCSFGRVVLLARATGLAARKGLWVEGNTFDGDYSNATAADAYNAVDIRGVEDVFLVGNRFSTVNPYRAIKLSSASGQTAGAITSGLSSRVVISGNLISGSMASGKQVIDLFAGTNRVVISGNVVTVSGAVGSVISTKPEGEAPAPATVDEVGPLIIENNIFVAPTGSTGLIVLAGPYGLGFHDPSKPASVSIRNNSLRATESPPGSHPSIQVRGFENAAIQGNTIERGAAAFSAGVMLGHVKRAMVADNIISFGEVRVSEGLTTPGGTPYKPGTTKQIGIHGNKIGGFDAPGAVWVVGVGGLEQLAVAGNSVSNAVDTPRIDGVVYIERSSVDVVSVTGNTAAMANGQKHRFRYGPATTVGARIRTGNTFDGPATP